MADDQWDFPTLVTGATGYIGRHLIGHLAQCGSSILALSRQGQATGFANCESATYNALESKARCSGGRLKVGTLVHLAGIAGRASLPSADGEAALALARQMGGLASTVAVRRVVLASSVYASAEQAGQRSPYGAHKLEIETALREAFDGELILLRLPPLYGGCEVHSGVSKLWRLVQRGFPLPFLQATALRDYLAIGNLVDLIERLLVPAGIDSGRGATVTYEPSDGRAISTRGLVEMMMALQARKAAMFPIPKSVMVAIDVLARQGGSLSAPFFPLRTKGNESIGQDTGWTPVVRFPGSLDYLQGAATPT